MIEIRLARPDRADHLIVLIQLMEPGAMRVIAHLFLHITHKLRVAGVIDLFSRHMF